MANQQPAVTGPPWSPGFEEAAAKIVQWTMEDIAQEQAVLAAESLAPITTDTAVQP